MRGILKHFILCLAIVGVAFSLSPTLIKADTVNPVITIVNPPAQDAGGAASGTIYDMCKTINTELVSYKAKGSKQLRDAESFLDYSYDGTSDLVTITVNMSAYKRLDMVDKQNVMQLVLDRVYNSGVSRTNRTKIYNELCNLDVSTAQLVRQLSDDVNADFASAYSYFKPFSSPLGIVLGWLALAIFALVGLSLVIDMAYICIPLVQDWLTNEKKNKALFASIEAYNAVKESESSIGKGNFKGAMGIYLGTKIKQYVCLFICLVYLVSGEIFSLLGSIINYFSDIINHF